MLVSRSLVALKDFSPLDNPDEDNNDCDHQEEVYKSPGTVPNEAYEPANNQYDDNDVKYVSHGNLILDCLYWLIETWNRGAHSLHLSID
jgi:hypothetical protein